MSEISLSEEEVVALNNVINSALTELHTEISHTDDREFKAALKNRQEIFQSILEKLAAVVK